MVHLASVSTDKEISDNQFPKLGDLDLELPGRDEFTASVYGSRFAACDIPRHSMPDDEMPREVAYRLIKDDLTLDGVPTLK